MGISFPTVYARAGCNLYSTVDDAEWDALGGIAGGNAGLLVVSTGEHKDAEFGKDVPSLSGESFPSSVS